MIAVSLGQSRDAPETTEDPDLFVVAGGQKLRALNAAKGVHVFAIPEGATAARLVSRASSPADARPWLEDRRCLGLYVERIVVRDGNDVRDIPLDHPDLSQGWWAAEREGSALRRWTDGDAVLPLPVCDHPTLLEIHGDSGGMHYTASHPWHRRDSSADPGRRFTNEPSSAAGLG